MNNSAKGSSTVKTAITAFVIMLSGTGAGVYAYVKPNSATPNATAVDSEWRRPAASDKNEQVLAVPPCKSDVMQSDTCRRYIMKLQDKKQTEAQASSNTTREQLRSLSDSDKKKLLVMLALWRVKS